MLHLQMCAFDQTTLQVHHKSSVKTQLSKVANTLYNSDQECVLTASFKYIWSQLIICDYSQEQFLWEEHLTTQAIFFFSYICPWNEKFFSLLHFLFLCKVKETTTLKAYLSGTAAPAVR